MRLRRAAVSASLVHPAHLLRARDGAASVKCLTAQKEPP
jgi:hypothetical protein